MYKAKSAFIYKDLICRQEIVSTQNNNKIVFLIGSLLSPKTIL